MATGVKRLDDLLDGGVPPQSATLVYGPPFIGKETLGRVFGLTALRQGMPCVFILTGAPASEVAAGLAAMDPDYAKYESSGLVWFVDAYSKAIGADEAKPNVEYVDGVINLNALSLALNGVQRKFIGDHPQHRIVFDNLSTLVAYTNAQTTYRFLQVLLGKAKRAGATSLLLLEQGMHADAEVQSLKHLANGVVEVRLEDQKPQLRVQGVGVHEDKGWVEYRATETTFEVTGSFGAGRIR